jgi:hypothetical protein
MATLLVTLAWRGRRRDLAVPADVPVADLLCPLAAAMLGAGAGGGGVGRSGATGGGGAGGGGQADLGATPSGGGNPGAMEGPVSGRHWAWPGRACPGRGLALAPLAGALLPVGRTLAACGVGDGAVLVLLG